MDIPKIKLKDVIEALHMTTDDSYAYYNPSTNQIEWITQEYMSIADEIDLDAELETYLPWEQEEIKKAYRIIYEDSIIMLPSKYDIHDYQIMKSYCYELPDIIQSVFLDAIHKKHAFKNFRYLVDKYQLTQNWYDYKESMYKKIAIDWLDTNNIEYE